MYQQKKLFQILIRYFGIDTRVSEKFVSKKFVLFMVGTLELYQKNNYVSNSFSAAWQKTHALLAISSENFITFRKISVWVRLGFSSWPPKGKSSTQVPRQSSFSNVFFSLYQEGTGKTKILQFSYRIYRPRDKMKVKFFLVNEPQFLLFL